MRGKAEPLRPRWKRDNEGELSLRVADQSIIGRNEFTPFPLRQSDIEAVENADAYLGRDPEGPWQEREDLNKLREMVQGVAQGDSSFRLGDASLVLGSGN